MAPCETDTGMHGAFNGFGIDAVHVSIPTLGSDDFERELGRISETVAASSSSRSRNAQEECASTIEVNSSAFGAPVRG